MGLNSKRTKTKSFRVRVEEPTYKTITIYARHQKYTVSFLIRRILEHFCLELELGKPMPKLEDLRKEFIKKWKKKVGRERPLAF